MLQVVIIMGIAWATGPDLIETEVVFVSVNLIADDKSDHPAIHWRWTKTKPCLAMPVRLITHLSLICWLPDADRLFCPAAIANSPN